MQTKIIPNDTLNQLLSESVQKRFWSKVKIGKVTDCWPYPSSSPKEYPRFTLHKRSGRRTFTAHKLAWTMANQKDVPAGNFVLHKCLGGPNCCNPLHLSPGDQVENMRDMKRQGRQNYMRGETAGNAKLTVEKVKQMRAVYRTKILTLRQIGKMFGVDPSNARKISLGVYWKHVH